MPGYGLSQHGKQDNTHVFLSENSKFKPQSVLATREDRLLGNYDCKDQEDGQDYVKDFDQHLHQHGGLGS